MPTRLLVFSLLLLIVSCKAARLRKQAATDHIIELREGVLLVRLHSGAGKAQAMERTGLVERAQQFTEAQNRQNEKIRAAFAEGFDYCPVYFFYARHSRYILANDTDGYLFDAALQPVEPLDLDSVKYLAAEFSRIQPPAAQSGMPALIVLNDSLQQIAEPFPFFVRTTFLGEAEKQTKAVRILNNNFIDYYGRARIWQEKQERKAKRRALGRQSS